MTTRLTFAAALIGFGFSASVAIQVPLLAMEPHRDRNVMAEKPPASVCYFDYQYMMDDGGTITLKGLRRGTLAPVAQISDVWTKADDRYGKTLDAVLKLHPDFLAKKNASGTTKWDC